jgi:hypothetical protein
MWGSGGAGRPVGLESFGEQLPSINCPLMEYAISLGSLPDHLVPLQFYGAPDWCLVCETRPYGMHPRMPPIDSRGDHRV